MYSVDGGDLEARERELVILRVSVLLKTWYEWAAHVDRGLTAGLTLQDIYRVAEGPGAADWCERDASLLSAVDQLVNSHGVETTTLESLEQSFSPRQILDIISLQGLYTSIACIIGTWKIEIEDHIAARLPEEITEAAFYERVSGTHCD